jgi:GH15 family glucan-1,4-alpha-glucosidase
VLETSFTTATGKVKVVDALTLQDGGLLPWIELVRRIQCVRGRVALRWRIEPRFDFGRGPLTIERKNGTPVARGDRVYMAVFSWDAGQPEFTTDSIGGRQSFGEGEEGLLACIFTDNEPIPFPPRDEVEERITSTCKSWRAWTKRHIYDGPWKTEVERSAIALKGLTYAASGAMAAAATTSLPEVIGGKRNFDYRFSWIRDSAFAMDALGRMGFREQVHQSLSWLLNATNPTHPRMEPLYALNGEVPKQQSELPLPGYRGTRPVLRGNSASGQLQLGTYGDLMETIRLYCHHGNALDDETATRVVEICNLLCEIWRNEDSGFWELSQQRHYTASKISAWGALDRALGLYQMGQISPSDADIERWQNEQEAIREFVETRCWSEAKQAYGFYADSDLLDCAVLLNSRIGFTDPAGERMVSTIDAIREHLSAGGPLLYRYSGMQDQEGAFIACSFWLVEALAIAGRLDEAREVMDGMVERLDEAREQMDSMLELANDVGLWSEEIDPETHAFRGNMPQALSHLALVNAAHIFHEVETEGQFAARAGQGVSH